MPDITGLQRAAPVDPDAARGVAEDILARPEFRPEPRSLLERFFDWLAGRLPDLDPGRRTTVPSGGSSGRGGAGLVTWLLLIAAAVLLVWLALRLTPHAGPVAGAARGAPDVTEALLDTDTDPATLEGLAARFEAEGRWREAVLMRYRGAVGRLDEAGLIALVPGRTTGELRGEVQAALVGESAPFDALTDTVEAGWYAGLPLDDRDADRARELAGTVAAVAAAHAVRRAAPGEDGDGGDGGPDDDGEGHRGDAVAEGAGRRSGGGR